MSVFKRPGSPYYYAEFIVNGHRVCRSTKATSEREARAVERRIKDDARAKSKTQSVKSENLSLDKAFGRYWTQKARDLSDKWAGEVKRYCAEILRIMPADICIDTMTDLDVNEFVQARLSEGAGPYAINRALAVWRRVHSVAKKTWKLPVQVIDWAEYMNPEKQRLSYFTMEEIRRLVASVSPSIGLTIEWSVYTGCRREETFGLTWDTVFMDRGYAEVTAKGGKEHKVWLGPNAMDVLGRCDRSARYVFNTTNWRRIFEGGLKKAGLEGRWHDLRHTHATWLRQAGTPLEVVQRSMGHADLATTTRYAHVADTELQTALHALPTISTNNANLVSIFSIKSASKREGTND